MNFKLSTASNRKRKGNTSIATLERIGFTFEECGEGFDHDVRIANEITKDIATLEDLMGLIREIGHNVMIDAHDMRIVIYDDYLE